MSETKEDMRQRLNAYLENDCTDGSLVASLLDFIGRTAGYVEGDSLSRPVVDVGLTEMAERGLYAPEAGSSSAHWGVEVFLLDQAAV